MYFNILGDNNVFHLYIAPGTASLFAGHLLEEVRCWIFSPYVLPAAEWLLLHQPTSNNNEKSLKPLLKIMWNKTPEMRWKMKPFVSCDSGFSIPGMSSGIGFVSARLCEVHLLRKLETTQIWRHDLRFFSAYISLYLYISIYLHVFHNASYSKVIRTCR